jgi:hypothetical protein
MKGPRYGVMECEVRLHCRLIREWVEWMVNEEGEETIEYWFEELREATKADVEGPERLGRVLMAEWWVNRFVDVEDEYVR